jgi:catechol 2,3-dioxygenase-like lactoylglutathione lyase family enzyme
MAETATKSRITHVGRVIVPVSHQDRALAFYRETLGFDVRGDIPYGDGERWLEVAPPGGATAIAIVPPREGDPVGVETRVALMSDNVDPTYEYLRGQNVDVDAEIMRMGEPVPPMFFFRDPDGNSFLCVEDAGGQPGT